MVERECYGHFYDETDSVCQKCPLADNCQKKLPEDNPPPEAAVQIVLELEARMNRQLKDMERAVTDLVCCVRLLTDLAGKLKDKNTK